MDIVKKRLGEQLKNLRKMKNFTQETLAENIGINLRQLARIEAGESFVSSDTLYKICRALDITPKTLFNFNLEEDVLTTDNNNSACNDMNILKNNLKQISNDKKKLEYMNLAFESLHSIEALNELKLLIKGIELMQK